MAESTEREQDKCRVSVKRCYMKTVVQIKKKYKKSWLRTHTKLKEK